MIANPFDEVAAELRELKDVVAALAAAIDRLVADPAAATRTRKWYTIAQAAERIGRKPYTIREWCRTGRIAARQAGDERRGSGCVWIIQGAEIERYENEGLMAPNPPTGKAIPRAEVVRG